MKNLLLALASLLAAFVGITWWALESGGVAVIETRAADGSPRATHVWFAEPEGALWLEAGTPGNQWFLDVQRNPIVDFSSSERSGRYIAEGVAGPESHQRIRTLLREKYGVRDWWVGLLVDTSASVAVRLTSPAAPSSEAPAPNRQEVLPAG